MSSQMQPSDLSMPAEEDSERGQPEQVQSEEQSSDGSDLGERQVVDLPKDIIFGLLSTKRRREVLKYLDENNGSSTLSDVAEHIAAMENGIDVPQLSSKQRKRVYIGLYQCHLPKMDDANVIDFNQARGDIELRPEADPLFYYMNVTPSESNGPQWKQFSFVKRLKSLWEAFVGKF